MKDLVKVYFILYVITALGNLERSPVGSDFLNDLAIRSYVAQSILSKRQKWVAQPTALLISNYWVKQSSVSC